MHEQELRSFALICETMTKILHLDLSSGNALNVWYVKVSSIPPWNLPHHLPQTEIESSQLDLADCSSTTLLLSMKITLYLYSDIYNKGTIHQMLKSRSLHGKQ